MTDHNPYVLGLTLGATTLGWAAVRLDGEGKPCGVLAMGTRVFPAGTTGDIETGRDTSRNAQRQLMRQQRRQTHRRAARVRAVFKRLQAAGLLPAGNGGDAKVRYRLLLDLDRKLAEHYQVKVDRLPYALRARLLDDMEPPAFALGRAILHLAQRRGFLSNRKHPAADESEIVKPAISKLTVEIAESGARTLGEYLAKTPEKIRGRYTARAMFEQEFGLLCDKHVALVNAALRRELFQLLFFQRPIGSAKHLVGECELEPGRKNAPLAELRSQRFRLLQRVNDLRAEDDNGVQIATITEVQRQLLVRLLDEGDMTWPRVRKALGVDRSVRFNLERGGDKSLVGNRTAQRIRDAVTDATWDGLTDVEQDKLVAALLTIEEPAGVVTYAKRLKLSPEKAQALSEVALEPGYLRLSRQAIAALLPKLQQGVAFATARTEVYKTQTTKQHAPQSELPLVGTSYRNPLIARGLSELRAVINLLVKKYGRPEKVRLKLSRALKQSRVAREQSSSRMRARQGLRRKAAEKLATDLGAQDPPPFLVDRVVLAMECGWCCPFTGRPISIRSLVGDTPDFYVRHILPFAQTLDDSMNNKMLCHVSVNAQLGQLPSEAMGDKWPAVQQRVSSLLKEKVLKEKVRRFGLTREEFIEEIGDEWVDRYDADNAYAARAARDYVAHLGVPVEAVRGGAAGYVRRLWGLGRIFDSGYADYRAHAVDAVAVATTGPEIVKRLSLASSRAPVGTRKLFADVPMPWAGFLDETRAKAFAIIVSFRVRRRARGPLHEQTHFSAPRAVGSGKKKVHLVRKPLAALSVNDVALIASESIRAVVQAALEKAGTPDPRKAFSVETALPRAPTGCIIRRVKVMRAEQAFVVGSDERQRYVTVEENHHTVVLKGDKGRWVRDGIVSQFDAQVRRAKRQPIVDRNKHGTAFVMTLSFGELFRLELDASGNRLPEGQQRLCRVRSVGKKPEIAYVDANDARKKVDILAAKNFFAQSVEQLRKAGCQKVIVDPLGEVRVARF